MRDPEARLVDEEGDEQEPEGAMTQGPKGPGSQAQPLPGAGRGHTHGHGIGRVDGGVTGVGAQALFDVGFDQGNFQTRREGGREGGAP